MSYIQKQASVFLFLFFSLFVGSSFHSLVFANTYGSGKYGDCLYGQGCTPAVASTANSTPNTAPQPPNCTDTKPGERVPWLYAAVPQDGNSIRLYYTDAADPVDHYTLEFGTKSNEYPYGATNIGDKGSRTYLVSSLSPNTTYYFRIRGGNGCATGEWSNEISAKTKGQISFNQLDFTESVLEPVAPVVKEPIPNTCQTYTVKSGDSLWNIATSELGDGNLYTDIIDQNKDTYPSLASSNSVSVGWKLKLNCEGSSEDKTTPKEEATLDSYIVNVNVVGKDQNPISGATVTIHSDPQEAVTDENGKVRFESVEPGEHKVLVAYNGYEGEQSIFLTGDTKEFTLNITLEMKNILMSRLFMAIVGGMGLVIAVLTFFLLRARFKKV